MRKEDWSLRVLLRQGTGGWFLAALRGAWGVALAVSVPGNAAEVAPPVGTHDDVQRLVDALPPAGGTVTLRAGRYDIGVPIRLRNGCRLEGVGRLATSLRQAAPDINLIEVSGAADVEIRNLRLIGTLPPDQPVRTFDGPTRLPLAEKKRFDGANGAVNSDDSQGPGEAAKNLVLRDLVCEHFVGNVIKIKGPSKGRYLKGLLVENVAVRHGAFRGISLYYVEDATVRNCVTDMLPGEQIIVPHCRDILIEHCICSASKSLIGINVGDESEGVRVLSNLVRRAMQGIVVEKSCRRIVIQGNHVSQVQAECIGVSANTRRPMEDAVIRGNVLYRAGQAAIRVAGSRDHLNLVSGFLIESNLISHAQFGVLVYDAADFRISGNVIRHVARDAFRIVDADRATIADNVVREAREYMAKVQAFRSPFTRGILIRDNFASAVGTKLPDQTWAPICLLKVRQGLVADNTVVVEQAVRTGRSFSFPEQCIGIKFRNNQFLLQKSKRPEAGGH